MTTPAEEAESTARTVARRTFGELSFLTRASAWRLRFTPDELRAAEVLLDALGREIESLGSPS